MNSVVHGALIFFIALGVSFYSVGFQKRYIWRYVLLIIGVILGEWYFSSQANAYEISYKAKIEIESFWENYYPNRALSSKNRLIYQANANWHTEKAYEEFNTAKQKCWCLPNLRDRERTKTAWGAFIIIMAPATPLHKAIAVLSATLLDYGCACIDEWYDIKELLENAQYNADMARFYQDLLGQ